MSDKTMYTITDFPEVARDLTRKNMAILYRTSAHHDQIEKAETPTLNKSEGEGSKGGNIIGHTTSGKPVYAKNGVDHESYKDFSPKDHHEAAAHHNTEQMTVLEGGKSKHGPKGQAHHEAMEVAHNKMAAEKAKKPKEEKTIGHTISGKPIHKKSNEGNTKDYTSTDHYNAMAVHKVEKDKHSEFENGEKNKKHEHHAKMMQFHKKQAASKEYDEKFQKAEETLIGACIENMIEKGEISDTLGRGYGPASEPIKFVKTGKELKEKIPTIITALTLEIGKAEGMMTEIQKEIGLEPNEPRNSYSMKNISIMSYNWDLCNPVYDKVQQCYPSPSDQNLLCSKYNSLGYIVISMQEDVATLNVMQGNLEDGKKYTLSVSQLIALGF